MVAHIFNHLCKSIRESYKHENKNVPYDRLLSELFHKSILIKYLKATGTTQNLEGSYGIILSTVVLGHMKIIEKKDVVKPEASLRIRSSKTTYIEDFPVIYKLDNKK